MKISVKAINALLPQTQCQECGFAGCLPYAEALAQGNVPINKCPPGGMETLKALAQLLNQDLSAYLNQDFRTRDPRVAIIKEEECIGCTKCIQACPVDAIIGTSKAMHAVISHECTGCGLCVEPCPVDCIEMLPLTEPKYQKELAKNRFEAKKIRNLHEQHKQQQIYRQKKQLTLKEQATQEDHHAKQAYILQALARSKAKKK